MVAVVSGFPFVAMDRAAAELWNCVEALRPGFALGLFPLSHLQELGSWYLFPCFGCSVRKSTVYAHPSC